MGDNSIESGWEMALKFVDGSEAFAHGFEAGLVWSRIRSGAEESFETTISTANIELVERMCAAENWAVAFTQTSMEEWTEAALWRDRSRPVPTRPNPRGLALVRGGRD